MRTDRLVMFVAGALAIALLFVGVPVAAGTTTTSPSCAGRNSASTSGATSTSQLGVRACAIDVDTSAAFCGYDSASSHARTDARHYDYRSAPQTARAAAAGADDSASLFRAVSQAEAADIARHGYRAHPGGRSMETKLFTTSPENAAQIGRQLYRGPGEYFHVVRVDVPRSFADGRIRYYGELTPARKPGEMAGGRLAREWNPATDTHRTWYETLDHSGRIRQVHPYEPHSPHHYIFDEFGNYAGRR